jgi:hypothetical protein
LAVASLIPVSDEVIISDGGSTDGTLEKAMAMASKNPKVRVVHYDFGDPVGDVRMLPRWLNAIRTEHCRYGYQLTLDADEVLCPKSYDQIRRLASSNRSAWYSRLNLWKDAHHLAPHNRVCAQVVVRSGPTAWETVSDGFYDPEPPIKVHATRHPSLRIFHLGFLRKREAFFAKSKVVQRALCNTYDSRLKEAEETGVPWTDLCSGWPEGLLDYNGDYPPGVAEWLAERGYAV